ncbi:Gustatory receptor 4 [Cephus cinctus]|uniref:Gustatory receptor n=1 Tax=Cephus cinctus TaxID=211228 RepID=A0A3L9LWA8_CEPCN|nr:putative gustatory receptor 28a [Cephus cinctus]RLZ02140.1 Gustatory receptor 4 [Cephus cinctus]
MKYKMHRERINLILLQVMTFSYKAIGLATFSIRSESFRSPKDSKVSVDPGNPNETTKDDISLKFVYSRCSSVYNVLLGCFLFGMNYSGIPSIYSTSYFNNTSLVQIIETTQAVCSIVVVTTAMFVYTVKQKTAVRIAGRIIQMDRILLRMDDVFRDNISTWPSLCYFLGSVGLLVNHLTLEVIAFDEDVISLFAVTFPSFIIYWLMLQYIFVVNLIGRRFKATNRALRGLIPRSNVAADFYPGIPLNLPGYVVANNSATGSIRKLQLVYMTLCEVCLEVSEYYGVPILLAITYCFYSLVYNAYYVLGPFVMSREEMEFLIVLNSISWVVILVSPIAVLAWSVTKTATEAKRTSGVVHKLLDSALSREAKIELKQFSLQLLHKNVSFSAFEFFTLDFTLLHSILSAAATYLIILLQFQMSEN